MSETFEIPQYCRFGLVEGRLKITGFPVVDLPPALFAAEPKALQLTMRVLCRSVVIHNERTAELEFIVAGKPNLEVVP
jgi:hypothetical protein